MPGEWEIAKVSERPGQKCFRFRSAKYMYTQRMVLQSAMRPVSLMFDLASHYLNKAAQEHDNITRCSTKAPHVTSFYHFSLSQQVNLPIWFSYKTVC